MSKQNAKRIVEIKQDKPEIASVDEATAEEKQDPQAEIMQRLTALEKERKKDRKHIETLKADIAELGHKANRINTAAEDALAIARDIERRSDPDVARQARHYTAQVRGLYELSWIKMSVATEVCFLARLLLAKKNPDIPRKLALACAVAFDFPDDWWKKRKHLELHAWVPVLTDIYDNGVPCEIVRQGDGYRLEAAIKNADAADEG